MGVLESYNAFVLEYAEPVKTFESALRNASLVLHGRFKDSDLVAEAVSSLCSALGFYHDSLYLQPSSPVSIATSDRDALSSPSSFATRAIFASSRVYRLMAYGIALSQSVELLLEMVAARFLSDRARLRLVALLETLKFIMRMVMLRLNGGRMLTGTPVPESSRSGHTDETRDFAVPSGEWRGRRSGVLPAPLAAPLSCGSEATASAEPGLQDLLGQLADAPQPAATEGESAASKSQKAVTAFVEAHGALPLGGAANVLTPLRGERLASEVLFHARPVVAAVAALYCGGGRAWTPWMLALAVDVAAQRLVKGQEGTMTPAEKAETNRRKLLMLYYLLRNPLFAEFLLPGLRPFADRLKKWPVISILGSSLEDYIDMCADYWFYTAAS